MHISPITGILLHFFYHSHCPSLSTFLILPFSLLHKHAHNYYYFLKYLRVNLQHRYPLFLNTSGEFPVSKDIPL